MTRKLVALVTAATFSLAAAAPAVQSMEMEFNMLTGAVYNALKARGLPTDGMDGLTLNQIGQIRSILNDDSIPESNQTQQIKAIMENQ